MIGIIHVLIHQDLRDIFFSRQKAKIEILNVIEWRVQTGGEQLLCRGAGHEVGGAQQVRGVSPPGPDVRGHEPLVARIPLRDGGAQERTNENIGHPLDLQSGDKVT